MSEQEIDLTPMTERTEHPPFLDAAVPAIMLIASGAYAWSLRDIVNADLNLLFLKPLFIAIWGFLLLVVVKEVIPSVRRQGEWNRKFAGASWTWRERFAPGTEGGAGLIVAATFAFSLHGPGRGPVSYIVSAFLYLAVVGYLIGDRQPFRLIAQAAVLSASLYFIMGFLLGAHL